MDYEKAYKESMRRTREFVERGSMTVDFAKAIFDDFEIENEGEIIRKQLIEYFTGWRDGTKFREIPVEKVLKWLEKQVPPKWLYRLEYKDGTCGLWYNGDGKWCFEQGIGSVEGCKTKDLPMDHDERYKQDGRDWFSSCSRKEDLMHWYSLEDAKELIKKGFVFTRYLATEYHEYENETVFIKESSLVREEIDIFELFGKTKPMFKEGDWIIYKDEWTREENVLVVSNPDPNGTSLYTVKGEQKYYLDWNSLKTARLWTSRDIKYGDILVDGAHIFIYKEKDVKDCAETFCSLFIGDKDEFIIDDEIFLENPKPAAKKYRDLLLSKIKRAGYEWDEKNMKLINFTLKEKEEIDSGFTQMMVDDKVKEDIKYVLANSDLSKVSTPISDMLDWIDDKDKLAIYLKEANKKKQELANENYYLKNPKDGIWHDGKEEAKGEFIFGIDSDGLPYTGHYKNSVELKEWAYVDDLISIRNKNEWSEEDKGNYKILLSHLRYEKNSASLDIKRKEWGELESWFKQFYHKRPIINKICWHDKNEEPEQERQVLICVDENCYVDFYHKRDKRFYMFLNPKHYLHEIDKWAYIDDIIL